MELEYVYCNSCGYEDSNIFVAYSRTTASGDHYLCPECNCESISNYEETYDKSRD
jgi:hypothetical protein